MLYLVKAVSTYMFGDTMQVSQGFTKCPIDNGFMNCHHDLSRLTGVYPKKQKKTEVSTVHFEQQFMTRRSIWTVFSGFEDQLT
jgi:hypothetical protein